MSQPSGPQFDVRGAVDLSALQRPTVPPPGEDGGAPVASGYVVDVTDASFQSLVESSARFPVVVLLWVPTDEANARLAALLGALADRYQGRFQLARVDVNAQQAVARAFQVQGAPTVVAVLQGQPIPLFQGEADAEQVAQVLDQLLAAAEQNGVTGRAPGAAGAVPEEAPEPELPPLPPLHQAAYDAIERDDLEGAAQAYRQALKEDPRDTDAKAGLAQMELLVRTRDMDLQAVRAAAAAAPDDVSAALDVADLDLAGGKVDDAFGRLLDLVRATSGDDRERLRVRLLDYFEIVGPTDPRVPKARGILLSALY
ncbi:co-chaperone YbbN [Luteimicrobium subarcticum]|uniref:Putative thioredoxin n=1 Tax=Luteimicrobium subarcticum TaxID=620910 RepID=A0A2M8W1F5_9MICO|nr:tetratricopeptide repeat protein [Luteimicrobium subarcticum]PJI84763.1 putative thioredoxin [Luteimicrobium subarcticum]